jgi:hypothetical protein
MPSIQGVVTEMECRWLATISGRNRSTGPIKLSRFADRMRMVAPSV